LTRARSSRLPGSRAQDLGPRSSPEHPRRRRPLRRHLGFKSNPTVPAIPVHDT
jgi:hypothetical protein